MFFAPTLAPMSAPTMGVSDEPALARFVQYASGSVRSVATATTKPPHQKILGSRQPPTLEKPMAKKISFPNRSCPKCGKPIHIRTKNHECGWVADGPAAAPPVAVKRVGRPRKAGADGGSNTGAGGISLEDITAVKKLVDQIGAEKVRQLAQVLAK
jgi:hypothetical protein